MANLIGGTTYLLGNEKALGLYEMNLQSPGSRGFHRYQIVHVVRDGKPTEFREDLGKAKKFKANQFRIPAMMEHTVDELKDMALWLRENPAWKKEDAPELNEYLDKKSATGTR